MATQRPQQNQQQQQQQEEDLFKEQKIYIYESTNNPSLCPSTSKTQLSFVSKIKNVRPGFTQTGPYNALDVETYISSEINDFISKFNSANKCSMSGTTKIDGRCSVFRGYSSTNGYLNYSLADPSSPFLLKNGKQLCQRSKDLKNLLETFEKLLGDIPETVYTNYNSQLKQANANNLKLRADLQIKLENLYNNGTGQDQKYYLDTTVYSTILWTVAATTILYYGFIKL